jgi:VanZ family protein
VQHKTSAWPLALIYALLVVYASLYPFDGWRDQGIAPWAFLASPLPKYWTGFDVAANRGGLCAAGFLLALSAMRRGGGTQVRAVLLADAGRRCLLSLVMEMSLQSYLPVRVASNVDLALNVAGAWLGALMAWVLERLGAIDRWSRFRDRWFVPTPVARWCCWRCGRLRCCSPRRCRLAWGRCWSGWRTALAEWLEDTPFLEWMPMREIELQPLVPGVELLCVMLGALIPCLLAYCVVRTAGRRLWSCCRRWPLGVLATALVGRA